MELIDAFLPRIDGASVRFVMAPETAPAGNGTLGMVVMVLGSNQWVGATLTSVARILRGNASALVRWCPRQDSNLRPSATEALGAQQYMEAWIVEAPDDCRTESDREADVGDVGAGVHNRGAGRGNNRSRLCDQPSNTADEPVSDLHGLAKDRGCTHPGCDVAGYYCEVHHVEDWARTHCTDVNQLTLACGPNHKLVEKGWITRKRANGDTEWIPPPHLDHGQPRINTFHHPEKLLCDGEDDDGP